MRNFQSLKNLLLMDGQGLFVWFVVFIFIIVILINWYLPYKYMRIIKKEFEASLDKRD